MKEISKRRRKLRPMSYNISSDKLNHPLLKPLLSEIHQYFHNTGIRFYVIGATARDIIMGIHNESSGRLTHDLDIAIAINNWSEFETVEKGLLEIPSFKKDTKQKQRFIYKDTFELDIVPYGEITKENDKIFWPPDEQFAMTVLGFVEIESDLVSVNIDEEIEIQIANLSGIFILKLVAWSDRNHKGNKDADDIGFILTNYLEIYEERAASNYYSEIYEVETFTRLSSGAILLGIDCKKILFPFEKSKNKVIQILQNEIESQEKSRLINQIIETNRNISFDEVLTALSNIIIELKK